MSEMGLLSADGTPAKTSTDGPIPVTWAFIVGIDGDGAISLIDHENVQEVRAVRPVCLDDIFAAAYVGGQENADDWEFTDPAGVRYAAAFVVFQMPNGTILASPDVFEDISPMTGPTGPNVKGAFGVLQAQIIAQKTADAIKLDNVMAAYAEKKNKSSLVTV